MIQHVVERARESVADRVIVATDDARIAAAVEQCAGEAVLTSPHHASGTDRLAEVARRLAWPDDHIVVNLQGDEPLLPGALLTRVARALARDAAVGIATLATPITTVSDMFDPNVVKVVCNQRGDALYFSRAPLPWLRESFAPLGQAPYPNEAASHGQEGTQSILRDVPALRHFGVYAYRVSALQQLASAPVAALEAAECLEQLRALYLGIRIRVEISEQTIARGVDTPEDLTVAEALLSAHARV